MYLHITVANTSKMPIVSVPDSHQTEPLWGLNIVSPEQARTFYLRGEERDIKKWHIALKPIGGSVRRGKKKGSDSDPGNNSTYKEGWLEKQGAKRANWKRRYFIMYQETLEYYERPESQVAKGIIDLRGATASMSDGEAPGASYLSISVPRDTRVYLIRGSTECLKDWSKAIKDRVFAATGRKPASSEVAEQAKAEKVAKEARFKEAEGVEEVQIALPENDGQQLQQQLMLSADRDELIAARDEAIGQIADVCYSNVFYDHSQLYTGYAGAKWHVSRGPNFSEGKIHKYLYIIYMGPPLMIARLKGLGWIAWSRT